MTYQKDCKVSINAWTKETFLNSKVKTADTVIKINYNPYLVVKNRNQSPYVIVVIHEKEYFIPLYDLQNALILHEKISKA